jgi:hypothetical protein
MATLTDQQKKFCEVYVSTGFDRKKAISESGYSERTGDSIACKLLKKSQIRGEIDRLLNQLTEKSDVQAQEIIKELRLMAFTPPGRGISNSDKLKALELLGKTLSLFRDGLSVSAEQNPRQLDAEEMEALQKIAYANNIRLACPNRPNLPPVDADFTPKDGE